MSINFFSTQICGFSGHKIFAGRGSKYIRNEGRILIFLKSKCRKYYLAKIKSVRVKWTSVYRKLKKKK